MRTLEHGQAVRLRPDAGVTLIELLVVVAVLSVLSVGVTFAIGSSGRDGASRDAARFSELWQRQSDFARQSRAPHGLLFETGALQPVRLGPNGWRSNGARIKWNAPVSLGVSQRPRGVNAPDLVILPSGHGNAFDVSFADGGGGPPVRCRGGGWDAVVCN